MGYDHLWMKSAEQPTKWLDLHRVEKAAISDELEAEAERLYARGNFVVLVAGKNYLHDELFLFDDCGEAKNFYDSGFKAWESFPDNDDEGCGFQEVSLYEAGHLVSSKSCEPTKRIEVGHE